MTAGHGNDFYGQWEFSKYPYHLRLIGYTDKLFRHRRNNFFSSQCRTPALDELQVLIGFVRTIDVNGDSAGAIEVINRNAEFLESPGRLVGAGHGAGNSMFDFSQLCNEEVGSGSGANTDDGVVFQ